MIMQRALFGANKIKNFMLQLVYFLGILDLGPAFISFLVFFIVVYLVVCFCLAVFLFIFQATACSAFGKLGLSPAH